LSLGKSERDASGEAITTLIQREGKGKRDV
jgi:hypothetical protein